jgi:sugar phosphate isomerase/epimerase
MNPLYCSTGTIVSRLNGYDYHLVTRIQPALQREGLCDGAELMMLPVYYDRLREIADEWLGAGIVFPVIHCEKEVGTQLSDAGRAAAEGDAASAERLCAAALSDFARNCEMAAMVRAPRMVLHLWGGVVSDRFVGYNVSVLPRLCAAARASGVRLLIENVPSALADPLSNWRRVLAAGEDCGLLFDTRFGQLHRQIAETWADAAAAARIEHIHVSDIRGAARDFSTLRPIYHPGEGTIDFPAFARILRGHGYAGTLTLESPVSSAAGADAEKLARSLAYVRELLCRNVPETEDPGTPPAALSAKT